EILFSTTGYEHFLGATPFDKSFVQAARPAAFLAPLQYNPNIDSQNLTLIVAAPIITQPYGVVALLLGVIPPKQLLPLVTPSLGLGRTGRSYVVSRDGYELGTTITPQTTK